MTTTAFNDGWSVRDKTSIFESLQGAAETVSVRLPHDALIHRDRSGAVGRTSHTGYFPSATVEYTKTIDIPEEYRDKPVTLELQGVYRDAMVYINGVFAAQRPFGYSGFYIKPDPFLDYGAANTIRVEARSHEDTRWYTGAGIYRERIASSPTGARRPDGVRIATPDIDARACCRRRSRRPREREPLHREPFASTPASWRRRHDRRERHRAGDAAPRHERRRQPASSTVLARPRCGTSTDPPCTTADTTLSPTGDARS